MVMRRPLVLVNGRPTELPSGDSSFIDTMPAHTFKGNNTGSAITPIDLTLTQLQLEIASQVIPAMVTIGGTAPSSVSAGQVAVGGGFVFPYSACIFGAGSAMIGRYGYVSGGGVSLNDEALMLRSAHGIAFGPANGGASVIMDTSGITTFLGTAPSSVSAGQVAIGNGLGLFAGSLNSYGANTISNPNQAVVDFLGGARLQSFGTDNATYGSISLIQRTANATARTALTVDADGYINLYRPIYQSINLAEADNLYAENTSATGFGTYLIGGGGGSGRHVLYVADYAYNMMLRITDGEIQIHGFDPNGGAVDAIYMGGGHLYAAGKIRTDSTADGAMTTAGRITAKVAVPASFADLAAVRSYLASILT